MVTEHRSYLSTYICTHGSTSTRTHGRTHTRSYNSGTWVQSQSQSQSQSQRPLLHLAGRMLTTHGPALTTDRARADRRALDTSTHGTGSGKPRRHAHDHARRLAHDGSKTSLPRPGRTEGRSQ